MRVQVEVFDEDVNDEDDSMGTAAVSLLDLVEGTPKTVTAKLADKQSQGDPLDIEMGDISLVLTINPAKGSVNTRNLR